jgi:hypothetical protein
MRSFVSLLLGIILLITVFSCKKEDSGNSKKTDMKPVLIKLWETPKTMLTSESAYFNRDSNVIYVSNINGQPLEENGKGYISKVSMDGKVLVEKWVQGLNAPKGIGVNGNKLYVSDITQVVEIDIKEGKISVRYPEEGSEFLNDISIDADGNVYVSDTNTKKIYRLSDGEIELWLESDMLDEVNGLYVEGSSLLIGTAGSVLKADLATRELSVYIENTGGIDGIVPDGKGNYLISDWAGNIHLVHPGKPKIKLLDTTAEKINAADIDYVISKHMLLVPTFFDNRVMAYKLENN